MGAFNKLVNGMSKTMEVHSILSDWLTTSVYGSKFNAKHATDERSKQALEKAEMRKRERQRARQQRLAEKREARRQKLAEIDELLSTGDPDQKSSFWQSSKPSAFSRIVRTVLRKPDYNSEYFQQFDSVSAARYTDKYGFEHEVPGVQMSSELNIDEFYIQQDMKAPSFGKVHDYKDYPEDMPTFAQDTKPTSGAVFKDITDNKKSVNVQRVRVAGVKVFNNVTGKLDDTFAGIANLKKNKRTAIIKNNEPRGMAYDGDAGSYVNVEGYTSDSVRQIADFYNGVNTGKDVKSSVDFEAFQSEDGSQTLYMLDLSKIDPNSKGLVFSDGNGGLSYAYDPTGTVVKEMHDPENNFIKAQAMALTNKEHHFDQEKQVYYTEPMADDLGLFRNLNQGLDDLNSPDAQATMIANLLTEESKRRQIEEAAKANKTIVLVDTLYDANDPQDEHDYMTNAISRVAKRKVLESQNELQNYPEYTYTKDDIHEYTKPEEPTPEPTATKDFDDPEVFDGDFHEVTPEPNEKDEPDIKEEEEEPIDDDIIDDEPQMVDDDIIIITPSPDNTKDVDPYIEVEDDEDEFVDPIIEDEDEELEEFIPDENIQSEQLINEEFDPEKYASYEEYINDFDYDYTDRELEAKAILDARMNNQPDPEPFTKSDNKLDTPDNVIQLDTDQKVSDLNFEKSDGSSVEYNIKTVDSDELVVCEVYNKDANSISYFPINKDDVYPDMDMQKMQEAALARDNYMDCMTKNASQTVHTVNADLVKQNPEISDVFAKVIASNYEFTQDSIANERAEHARMRERAANALDKSNKEHAAKSISNDEPDLSMVN